MPFYREFVGPDSRLASGKERLRAVRSDNRRGWMVNRALRFVSLNRASIRFIDGVNLCAAPLFQFHTPAQKRFLFEPLRWFGIAASPLHHHDVMFLVQIDSELDHRFARIKLQARSLV
jgi:hypothetical protein